MRLISDEDLKDRASEYCLSEDEFRRFCEIIDAEPTACDIHKKLEEHDWIVKLPCKVGDTAYCIENKEIWICIVENISMSKNNGTWIEISFPPEMPDISAIEYSPNEIGEVVFFTKPEAEAKLEELGCCEDEKASDEERFYQCLNCLYIEDCNLDEKAEDKRGMCKKYLNAEMCVGRCREKYCNKCISEEQCYVPCGSVTRYIFEMLKK